jgi:Tfp pilus assembly protein PilF
MVMGVAVFCVLTACASTRQGAKNPERQSQFEYDIAVETFNKGDPRAALDHCLKAVELDEENVKALYFTSAIYASFCHTPRGFESPDCQLDSAEKYARLAIKADPTFRDARNLLGQVLINEKKYAEAIAYLEPLTKDPSYIDSYKAWGNLGWAQVLAGHVDQGIVSLKNSITEPRFCVGHYRLGIAYEKKGDLAQAEASFTNAVEVEHPACKSLQDAWEARARIRQRLGKSAEACADYGRCREIAADTPTGGACARIVLHQCKASKG